MECILSEKKIGVGGGPPCKGWELRLKAKKIKIVHKHCTLVGKDLSHEHMTSLLPHV